MRPSSAGPMGGRFGYRIDVRGETGEHRIDERWITLPAALSFELDGATPNPASRTVAVSFTTAKRGESILDLIDATGRRVMHRRLELEAGHHRIDAAPQGTLAPGVYVVRLTHGGVSRARTVSVVR